MCSYQFDNFKIRRNRNESQNEKTNIMLDKIKIDLFLFHNFPTQISIFKYHWVEGQVQAHFFYVLLVQEEQDFLHWKLSFKNKINLIFLIFKTLVIIRTSTSFSLISYSATDFSSTVICPLKMSFCVSNSEDFRLLILFLMSMIYE